VEVPAEEILTLLAVTEVVLAAQRAYLLLESAVAVEHRPQAEPADLRGSRAGRRVQRVLRDSAETGVWIRAITSDQAAAAAADISAAAAVVAIASAPVHSGVAVAVADPVLPHRADHVPQVPIQETDL
jgi:hypothetical protein